MGVKTLRLAVISDIHSNFMALKMALESIKSEHVDKICFLGDYITDGENENEILSTIKNVADYVVLGNREKYILNYSPSKKEYNNYKTIHSTYSNLNIESLEYIKSMRESYTLDVNGHKILLIHGDRYKGSYNNLEQVFDKMIDDYDFDICLFGHTHRFLKMEYKNRVFINPGSIGMPDDYPSYKYCIVEIDDHKINVTMKEFDVSKSFKELSVSYKNTKYYKTNPTWANLCLLSSRDAVDYCSQFVNHVEEKTRNAKELSAAEFNKIWNEVYEEFIKTNNLNE